MAQRIRKGDRIALEKLTKANLRFVVSVAKQYQNQGLGLPDLINEGNLGLIKAVEKFDFMKSKLTGKRPSFSRGSLHALAVQCKDIPGTLARQALGHNSRPLADTIKDTVRWVMDNG